MRSAHSHLQRLEAESIHIMREVAANFARPVMLYSIGKDSSVLLHLAMKAFYPAKPPFPILHVDTTWKFREMIAFRDRMARELGFDLLVHVNEEGVRQGISPFTHGAGIHTHVMKTLALRQAMEKYGFDAAFGGARRDEEKSRAKERIFSFRNAAHAWDPKNQRPEMWKIYNTRVQPGESIRVFPLSNWTELDIWQYILLENIPIPSLYLATRRPVVNRGGQWIMVDDERMPIQPGEVVEERMVRFRTLGCYPLTAAIESEADTLEEVVAETLIARSSERQGRLIDHDEAGSMEKKKREGYLMHAAAEVLERPQVTDVRAYIAQQQNKSLLRFITCGSVDDGKSTLVGRLLYDTKLVFEDQLAALHHDSLRHGTNGRELDLALLVDGLEAEREQGITIDVAYRFFSTARRKFIVADTPGHAQYTRNMATGASTADLAVVLVNAKAGLLQQTRRHTIIASLLGIRHIVLAVNKIDLVDFDQNVFEGIREAYEAFAEGLGFATIQAIPMSAKFGDNVIKRSASMDWYGGPTLIEHLESVEIEEPARSQPFRFPVQYVNRPNADFRGFAGTIAAGSVRVGDEVLIPNPRAAARVSRIVTCDGDLEEATRGQAVTLVLDREVDVSRGTILSSPERKPHVADQLTAQVIWFHEEPLAEGRIFLLRTETDQVSAKVTRLDHRIDINTYQPVEAKALEMNEVGACEFSLQAPITFDAFADNKATGSFILVDRMTNATVGAGMFLKPLRRAANIQWQKLDVNKAARAEQKQQKPVILWFTGLSGSGKSTIANLLERKLHASGQHTYILDGDNVRHGLNRDLGFSPEDRIENIRRVAEVAKLMADAGLIVLVSLISPYRAERAMARQLADTDEFVEIFVDTPLEECIARDPKGLYARALKAEIRNFTGIDAPYEAPETPDVHLKTMGRTPEDLVAELENWLREHGYC